jgi:ribosomal protein S18 acetylase RimI-like enzyme
MPPTPDWTIEELASSAPGTISDAELDRLEPLWRSLMDRHRQAWEVVAMRSYEDSWRRRRAQYRRWLSVPGSFVLVARRGDRLVGYAVVGIEEGDETYATGDRQAEICTLAVLPGERDQGLGGALVKELERRLLAEGVTDLFVGTMQGNDAAPLVETLRGYTPFVHVNYRRLAVD